MKEIKGELTPERLRVLNEQHRSFGSARMPLELFAGDDRIVVAGNEIYAVPREQNFHEFLITYGLAKIGRKCVEAEHDQTNPKHPIAKLLLSSTLRIQENKDGSSQLHSIDKRLYGFIKVAYDLFTVADNASLQSEIIKRLFHVDQYQGARYELYVAAAMIRGDFTVDFEDETDSETSHCEFTAVAKQSSKSYSVEAKSLGVSENFNPGQLKRNLGKALRKHARFERIVFLDLNTVDSNIFASLKHAAQEIGAVIESIESSGTAEKPWPSSILFLTNRSAPGWPQSPDFPSLSLITAINNPVFKTNDADSAEKTYPELGKAIDAVMNLDAPPVDFFGTLDESNS